MTDKDPNILAYPFYDDISLFDIAETLWRKKILIIGISVVFVLFSVLYLMSTEWKYESEILIEFRLGRPGSLSYIVNDMRDLFEDDEIYNEWAQPTSVLKFSHINKSANIEGFSYTVDTEIVPVVMVERQKRHFFIVRDKDVALITDVKNYVDFLNEKLTDAYKSKTLADLILLEKQIEIAAQGEDLGDLAQTGLNLKKYLAELEAGNKVAVIHLPTPPVRISPKPIVTMLIAAILGGIMGCGFVLVYDGYQTYRRNKSETA